MDHLNDKAHDMVKITAGDLKKGQIIKFDNQLYKITDCTFGKGLRRRVHAHVTAINVLTSEKLEQIFTEQDIIIALTSTLTSTSTTINVPTAH